MKCRNQIVLLFVSAFLAVGCGRGSVSDTPVSQCYPAGKCDKEMLERGFSSEGGDLVGGAKLYQTNCATCHGPNGEGSVKSGKIDFTATAWQAKMTDMSIANTIRNGRPPLMPPFSFTKEELEDLVKHIRSSTKKNDTTKKGGY
jgi:mono/diheme cytochrome c family protein